MNKQTAILIFLGLIILSTLVNNNVFESIVSAAYYYYAIIATVSIGITGILIIKYNSKTDIFIPTPILLFFAIPVYYIFQNALFYNHEVNIPKYLILNALLLFSYYTIFGLYSISLYSIFKLIAIIAFFESLFCLFQFFGLLKTATASFNVTGTWVNPNVTAIFLALAWPAILFLLLQDKKWFYFIMGMFILIALALLKCRTAFVGIAISTFLILNYQFKFFKKNIKYKILVPSLLGLVFIFLISYNLSKTKQASTYGRLFVWQISLNIIAQKPLIGTGYDSFIKEYNYAQASYFKSNKATKEEIDNASFVTTAYNELLNNFVEGGFIGFVIILSFFISVLINYNQISKLETLISYAACASFIIMALFNFAFSALPAMCLFMLYVAMLCYSSNRKVPKPIFTISLKYKYIPALVLIATSCYFFFNVTSNAVASSKSKKATTMSSTGENDEAITIFEPLQNELNKSNEYFKNYGNALFMQKNIAGAIIKYKQAINLVPDPDVMLKLGFCYQQTKQFEKGLEVCVLAHNIVPNRVLPLFSQMSIYLYAGDTSNAKKMAKQVVEIKPKVTTEETNIYKKQANLLLTKLSERK